MNSLIFPQAGVVFFLTIFNQDVDDIFWFLKSMQGKASLL